MNSVVLIVVSVAAYLLAYRVYGRYLGGRVFQLSRQRLTPAHRFRDNVDFVPSSRHVVLGHHFTTIAGLGPIVGPAIGIIWGWLPAFLWIIFGAIFMGAVHDFAAMIISARNDGKSIGELTGQLISPATRLAFQVIIQFLLWIVVAIFAMIIGVLLNMYPAAVLPVFAEIPIALWLGRRLRSGAGDLGASLVAVLLLFAFIALGVYVPFTMPALLGSPVNGWVVVLLVYAFFASTLPVDLLLQPRDYINSHQLLIVMGLLGLGVLVAHPEVSAPALNPAALVPGTDIPPVLPLLFITIACGAISGFHSLAASGTSVKQLDNEADVLLIGYGGMFLEGVLAALVLVTIAGGLGMGLVRDGVVYTGVDAFNFHYRSWASANGLASNIDAFVTGAANLMAAFGLPASMCKTLMAVFIVSFAGTTLDSAARIQRLSLQELCRNRHGKVLRPVNNRYAATLIVVGLAALLAFAKPGAKGALILWPLFGALNQLLAALGLTVAAVYLRLQGRNSLVALLPMLFMLGMTFWAMFINLGQFLDKGENLLVALSLVIFGLTLWLLTGALPVLWRGAEKGRLVAVENAPVDD